MHCEGKGVLRHLMHSIILLPYFAPAAMVFLRQSEIMAKKPNRCVDKTWAASKVLILRKPFLHRLYMLGQALKRCYSFNIIFHELEGPF